jgi:CBS domain containing-hemolysin-like protein
VEPGTAFGLVAVVALVLANGYFVAAEFAFVAVKRGRIEALAEGGDHRATRALDVLKRLSFMLSGAQLGITVTSLLVGFIAEPALGAAIQPVLTAVGTPESSASGIALTIGFLLATGGQMVVGELAPKNLAIAKPEPVSRALASSTLLFLTVAGPLIRLFDSAANRLLRSVGIEPVEELETGVSAEELELIVVQSRAEGHLDEDHTDALLRALEFRDLDAGAASVPLREVASVAPDATLVDVRALVERTGHSRFPVLDESGTVLGIIGTKDLLEVPRVEWRATVVASRARAVPAAPDTSPLGTVLGTLRDARSQSGIVVDEHGSVTGLITLEDIVEELVGEIRDEHDPPEGNVVAGGDEPNTWTVAGRARLDEVERVTSISLPGGDYNTVAGLVVARLGRLAEPGDVVTVHPRGSVDVPAVPVRLQVECVEGYQVTTLTMHAVDPGEEATR